MIRFCRLVFGLALLMATLAACAGPWTGGRGMGNRGAFPDVVFPKNPATVWKAYLGKDFVNIPPSNTLVCDDVIIFAFGRYLFGFSTGTGEYLWHIELTDNILGDLLLLDNQVIVSHPSGQVTARDPATGKVLWKQELTGGLRSGPTVTETALYLTTKEGTVEGIERKTGKHLGQSRLGDKLEAGPLLYGRSLILSFPNGKVIRVDEGIIKWDVHLPNSLISLTPVTDGKSTVVVNTTNTIYALNPGDRNAPVRWLQIIPDRMPAPVTLDNNKLYIATRSSRLICLDLMTGRQLWTRTTVTVKDGASVKKTETGVSLIATPVGGPLVVGKFLLVRMQSGLLALHDKETGKLEWVYRTKAPVGAPIPTDLYVGEPAIDGTDIYFPCTDGNLYHLSAAAPDIDPPVFSKISPAITDKGFIDPKGFTTIGAAIDDEGCGLQPSQVTMRLDSTDLTPTMRHDPKTSSYYVGVNPAAPLEPGMHRLVMTAKDFRGNMGTLALNFIIGTKDTAERVPLTIAGEILPRHLKVKPGTIVSWTNKSGGPRTIIGDTGEFSSDAQYPDGIPDGETWVWIVPDDMELETMLYYHDRLNGGKPGDGENYGTGLVGLIEVAEPEKPVENPDGMPGGPGIGPGPAGPPPPLP
jgi:outer membrane protein assembly factor BamB